MSEGMEMARQRDTETLSYMDKAADHVLKRSMGVKHTFWPPGGARGVYDKRSSVMGVCMMGTWN
jgi:hypothetical protein